MPTKRILKPDFGRIHSVPYRSHPRYRGCIGHWIMVEGGGTTVRDISGHNSDGIMTNMDPATDWVSGQFGRALDFDAVNDRVRIATFNHNIGTGPFTASCWVNLRTRDGTTYRGCMGNGTFSPAFLWRVGSPETSPWGMFWGVDLDSTGSTLLVNQWYHLIWTRSGSTLSFYEDGKPVGTQTVTDSMANGTFNIGGRQDSSSDVDGQLDECRFYNRSVSAAEAKSLYEDPYLEFRDDFHYARVAAGGPVFLSAIDNVSLAVVESATLLSLSGVLDTLDLAIVEGPGQVAAGVTAEDALGLTVVESTADLLGLIQPVDTTGLSIVEVVEVLSLAERLDALGISISEVADLLGFLSRSDALDLEIVESPAQVAVGIGAEDTLDLDIAEGPGQVVVGIAREDTLDLSLVEQVDLLGFIQRSDAVALTIVEGVPLLLVQGTATDLLDLEINEDAGQVSVGIQAEDVLDLAVVEAVGQVVVGITSSDLLDLSVSEVAQVVGFLNRSDILDLDLSEQTDLLAFIQAADDLGIEILDVAALVSALQAADNLNIDLVEFSQVFNAISVLDTLDVDLTESPGVVLASVPSPFQGILVQPITLQVTRVARFQLQATRVAKFQLQIEGSGEQRS